MRNRRLEVLLFGGLTLFGCGEVTSSSDAPAARIDASANDFSVTLTPRATLRPSGTVDVEVTIDRSSSITGEIVVTAIGLPAGVTASPLTIAASAGSGMLRLSALAGAALGAFPYMVQGVAGSLTRSGNGRLLVAGQPGTLDPTFASGGRNAPLPAMFRQPRSLLTLDDGSAIVAGSGGAGGRALLLKVNEAGAPDSTFGSNGFAMGPGPAAAVALALTPIADGSLIASGSASLAGDFEFAAWKFSGSGQPDASFGVGGVVSFDGGVGPSEIHGAQLQADGSVLMVGTRFNSAAGFEPDSRVIRLSGNTMAGVGASIPSLSIQDIFPTPGGGYVAVGSTNGDVWFAQVGADGSFAPGAPPQVHDYGSNLFAPFGVLPAADGKWLIVGHEVAVSPEIFLARLHADGRKDLSFGTAGVFRTGIPFIVRGLESVLLDSAGRILIGGATPPANTPTPAIMRLFPTGSIDTAFGTSGVTTLPVTGVPLSSNTGIFALAFDTDGRIVAAGDTGPISGRIGTMYRLFP